MLVAINVSPFAALSIVSPVNVATPLTACTVNVPPSVALPGFALKANVTLPLNVVAMLPYWSFTLTVMPNGLLASMSPGDDIVNCPAAAEFTLKELLLTVGRPLVAAYSESPLVVVFNVRPENVATPFTACTVVVPPKVYQLLSPIVTFPLKEVFVDPSAFSAVTTMPKGAPAVILLGGWVVTTKGSLPNAHLIARLTTSETLNFASPSEYSAKGGGEYLSIVT